jgi:hypothetical protein
MSDIWSAEYKATILDELRTANDANEYLSDQLAAATARAESAEARAAELQRDYDSAILGEAKRQLEAEHGSLLTVIPTGTLEEIKAQAREAAEADAAKWREDSEWLAGRLRGAEQTIRNLGHGALTGDYAQIALNEAANIRAALSAHDEAKGERWLG